MPSKERFTAWSAQGLEHMFIRACLIASISLGLAGCGGSGGNPGPPPPVNVPGRWRYGGCSEWHTGLMDLAALVPDPWPHREDREPNSALRLDGDFLSEDFCVIGGKDFLVRAVLEIPVHGLAEKFGFGL